MLPPSALAGDDDTTWRFRRGDEERTIDVAGVPDAVRAILLRRMEADGWARLLAPISASESQVRLAHALGRLLLGEATEAAATRPEAARLLARVGRDLAEASASDLVRVLDALATDLDAPIGDPAAHPALARLCLDLAAVVAALAAPVLPVASPPSPTGSPPTFEALGATLRAVSGEAAFEVTAVRPGSPAARADLRPGDRVLGVDDLPAGARAAGRLAALLDGSQRVLRVARRDNVILITIREGASDETAPAPGDG